MTILKELLSFIEKQPVSFIASIDQNGCPNVKAMLPPRKIACNVFYFTTNTSSMRVAQYRENPKASIYFFEKGVVQYQGVMLLGTMEVLEDDTTKREIWQDGDTVYYPKGVTDPDYCVLKFTAQEGRYYCNLKTESFLIEPAQWAE